jgi:hypothetical protein
MTTQNVVIFYTLLRLVFSLSRSDYAEKGYMRTANGSFILSQQIAYIHKGIAKQIEGRISVRQPISLMETKSNLEYLFMATYEAKEQCDSIRTLYEPTDDLHTFDYPDVTDQQGNFVVFDKNSKYTPHEVEARCHRLNMKVPEPETKEQRVALNHLRSKEGLWGILVASTYSINAQAFVSPYSGKPLEEVYPSLLRDSEINNKHADCPIINWNNYFVLIDESTIMSWMSPDFAKRRGTWFSRMYKYWPGTPEEIRDEMYDTDGSCPGIPKLVRRNFGVFPLVCQEYDTRESMLKDFHDTTISYAASEKVEGRVAYKDQCLAQYKVQNQRLKLILRDFSILVKQLGIDDSFLQGLINFYIPTMNLNVHANYAKRSVSSVLKIMSKTGIFGLGGNVVSAFLDARDERMQDARIDSLFEEQAKARQLSLNNAAKIQELKVDLMNNIGQLHAKLTFQERRQNLTSLFALVETAITYLDKEIYVFRTLIQQAVHGEIPEYMQVLTEELGVRKFLKQTFPTMVNADMVVETGQPVIIAESANTGEFILVMNYAVLSNEWDLYQIVPIPSFEGNYIKQRKIPFEYIALDYILDQYVPINKDVIEDCSKGFCYIPGARQRVQSEECAVSPIVGDKPKKAPCTVDYFAKRNFYYPTPYGVIYSVENPLTAHVICPESQTRGSERNLELKGVGVLEITPGCFVQTHEPDLLRFEPLPTTRFVNITTALDVTRIVNTPLQLMADYDMPLAPDTNDTQIELTGYVQRILDINHGFMWKIIYTGIAIAVIMVTIFAVSFYKFYWYFRSVRKLKSKIEKKILGYIDEKWQLKEKVAEDLANVKESFAKSLSAKTVPVKSKKVNAPQPPIAPFQQNLNKAENTFSPHPTRKSVVSTYEEFPSPAFVSTPQQKRYSLHTTMTDPSMSYQILEPRTGSQILRHRENTYAGNEQPSYDYIQMSQSERSNPHTYETIPNPQGYVRIPTSEPSEYENSELNPGKLKSALGSLKRSMYQAGETDEKPREEEEYVKDTTFIISGGAKPKIVKAKPKILPKPTARISPRQLPESEQETTEISTDEG